MKCQCKSFLPKFIFWFVIFLFYELVLRFECVESFFNTGILFITAFSLFNASLATAITTGFNKKAEQVIGAVLLFALFLFFAVQTVYHNIFQTYCTIYATVNGGEAFMFASVMFKAIWQVKFYLLAELAPVLAYIFLKKYIFNSEKCSIKRVLFALGSLVINAAVCAALLFGFGTAALSPYSLYFGTPSTDLSVEKLGMLTTFGTDLRRTVFGYSSTVSFLPEPGSGVKIPASQSDKYNMLDIDFEDLAENESDSTVQALDRYFATVSPTEINEKTGIYNGKNIILLTCESLAPYAITEQLTPTLYNMMTHSTNFTSFYAPLYGTGTSDAEFAILTGLIPRSDIWSMNSASQTYFPFTLANQLKSAGYKTLGYHNNVGSFYNRNVTHPNLGYTFKATDSGLKIENPDAVPASDIEMIEATTDEYLNSDTPFHVYYMTYSGHSPYTLDENSMAQKNWDSVKDLTCSDEAKTYLAGNIELDNALSLLLKKLKQAKKLDDTVIVITADHYPYSLGKDNIKTIENAKFSSDYDYYKSVFFIYDCSNPQYSEVSKLCGNADILPTLSNMFGLSYDSRLLMGRDIFSSEQGIVILRDGSWLTDKAYYNASLDILSVRNGSDINEDYREQIQTVVTNRINCSMQICDSNYYAKIFD